MAWLANPHVSWDDAEGLVERDDASRQIQMAHELPYPSG